KWLTALPKPVPLVPRLAPPVCCAAPTAAHANPFRASTTPRVRSNFPVREYFPATRRRPARPLLPMEHTKPFSSCAGSTSVRNSAPAVEYLRGVHAKLESESGKRSADSRDRCEKSGPQRGGSNLHWSRPPRERPRESSVSRPIVQIPAPAARAAVSVAAPAEYRRVHPENSFRGRPARSGRLSG